MQRIKFLLIIVGVLTESACSSLDTFAVLNNTGTSLRLEYTFKVPRSDDVSPPRQLGFIATVATDKAGEADCPWTSLSPTEYYYDQATRKVTVQVPPRTAVRIAEATTYVETKEWAAEKFPIASIAIDGARGTLQCDGEQARKQFKNLKRSLHAIAYE